MPAILTLTTADGQLLDTVNIPTRWADVTLGQYLALVALDSPSPDAVMTGLAPEMLSELSEADRSQLLEQLLFLTDTTVLQELVPTPGLYEIGNCAYGLYRQAEEYFAANPTLLRLGQGAYLYALYHTPPSPKLTAEQLAAAHAAVLAAPITEVYANCCYFLASWERHQSGTTRPGPTPPSVLRIAAGQPTLSTVSAPAAPTGWLSKLGTLWDPTKRALA